MLEHTGAFFLRMDTDAVIKLPMCNHLPPRICNALAIFRRVVSSNDPSLDAITWNRDANVIRAAEPCSNQTFQVGHISFNGASMICAGKDDRAKVFPFRAHITLYGVPLLFVWALRGKASTMRRFLFAGNIPVHLYNQEIQGGLNTPHEFFPNRCAIMAPFPNAFPAIPIFPGQIIFRLKLEICVFLAGNFINHTA